MLQKFKEFEATATNEADCKIGTLRTDNAGEYMSSEFEEFLKNKGIKHETSVAYSPQQNEVSERMNRTLLESARAMMCHAGLSKIFWAEAVNTAAYIRNRVTTTSTGQTPYERWYGKCPDVSHMRVFGCTAYAHIPEAGRKKLDKKSNKWKFLGYAENQKGYRLLDMTNHKLIISRDVIFNEVDFNQQKQPVEIQPETEDEADQSPQGLPENSAEKQSQQTEPRQSTRVTKGKKPMYYGFDEYADVTEMTHIALRATIEEPKTIQEALNSEYSEQWKAAADSEYQSLIENKTWNLEEPPVDRSVIGCKWIFKVKYGSQGQVEHFKGRLVAKGYSQKYGIDFDETFSPVVRFDSIRALLAFAIQKRMLIHQMDVVSAFLHGDLEEVIYMEQPEGYVIPGKENMVCQLKKSLYGLKQSPRCWNRAFTDSLKSLNFTQSQAEPCIFIRRSSKGHVSIIALYVDDLIIVATTETEMNEIKASLRQNFKMTDMGSLHFCLRVHVEQSTDMIKLSQKQYIQKLLKKYGLDDANPVSTPMDLNVRLVADDGSSKLTDKIRYQSMVGSLLYVAVATRPDISQAVRVVSKFNSAPTEAHLNAVKRILRYLKGTLDL